MATTFEMNAAAGNSRITVEVLPLCRPFSPAITFTASVAREKENFFPSQNGTFTLLTYLPSRAPPIFVHQELFQSMMIPGASAPMSAPTPPQSGRYGTRKCEDLFLCTDYSSTSPHASHRLGIKYRAARSTPSIPCTTPALVGTSTR